MATVVSKDGTTIGYDRRGSGPAIIMVHGATTYRQFPPHQRLPDLLAREFTVFAYDRRGRGESGDTPPYAVAREIEDIRALIAAAGGSCYLYGISSGACLAFEAAMSLGAAIEKLAMYEPPYNSAEGAAEEWREYGERLAAAVAEGRNGDAVALFMSLVEVPPEMIEGMRQSPVWQVLEAVAPTLVYDRKAVGDDRKVPTERATRLAAPTLVMNGTTSPPFMADTAEALAAAIPDGRHVALEGQSHDVDPEAIAPTLIEFFKR